MNLKAKLLFSIWILFSTLSIAKEPLAMTSGLKVENAQVFLPIPGSPVTGGFGLFKNLSTKSLHIKVHSIAPFKFLEIHASIEKDGRMAMQKIEELVVPPLQTIELKHGSYHIMLFEPSHELKAGETLKMILSVNGKKQSVDFKVVERP